MAKTKSLKERIKQGTKKRVKEDAEQASVGRKPYLVASAPNLKYATFKGEEAFFDVVPYIPGENDPRVMSGEIDPKEDIAIKLPFHTHPRIGPGEETFICVQSTFNKPCWVCIKRNEKRKAGADYEEVLKPLMPKPRELYNINPITEVGAQSEFPEVLDVSWHMMGKSLAKISKKRRAPGETEQQYIDYASPLSDGKTIGFDLVQRNVGNFEFTAFEGHKLIDREGMEIPDILLENAFDLVELLNIPRLEDGSFDFDTYSKMVLAAIDPDTGNPVVVQQDRVDEESEDEEDSGGDEEQGGSEEEPESSDEDEQVGVTPGECPYEGGEFGVTINDFDECEKCPIWDDCLAELEKQSEPEPEPEPEPPKKPTPAKTEKKSGGLRRRKK